MSVPLHVIHSNAVPTESEKASIRRSIPSDEAAIKEFGFEIERTLNILSELRAKRRTLRTHLARKRTLLAPIQCLPPEILSMFIELAITRTFRRKRDSSLVKRHPVLRVCQRWRAIAEALPHLWADIQLYPRVDAGWHDTLAKCVKRSGSLPLDLCMKETEPRWRPERCSFAFRGCTETDEWRTAGKALLAGAPRWRTLRLAYDPPDDLLRAAPAFPQLTFLHVEFVTRQDTTLFQNCPALVKARIDRMFVDRLELPWSQLKELTLEPIPSIGIKLYGAALSQCQALLSLTLTTTPFDNEFRPLITLPCLQSATLHKSACSLLFHLIAPNLQGLSLHSDKNDMDEDSIGCHLDTLMAFAVHNHTITQSKLVYLAFPVASGVLWDSILLHFPTVSHLRLNDDISMYECTSVDLMGLLITRPDYLPKLVRLDLHNFGVEGPLIDKPRAIEDLLRHRTLEMEVGALGAYQERLTRYSSERGAKIGVREPTPFARRCGYEEGDGWDENSDMSSDSGMVEGDEEIAEELGLLKSHSDAEDEEYGGSYLDQDPYA